MPSPSTPAADVVAVLVAHDGGPFLPRTLAALAAQTVRPAVLVGVDTGSTDGTAALLAPACDAVVPLPRTAGFPEAVHAGLAAAPPHAWVWLLHDDAAPDPGALQALLAHAAVDPSAVLLGPKVRDWDDPRVLVEAGLTVDAAGHRETGLEPGEHDQGQHDAVRDVLAVGTAGALVRRDVWDAVGGLDPALPLLRDDVDLGWTVNALGARVVVVPAAVVAHARAVATGRRPADALPGPPAAVDRRHALLVRLAHAAPALLPLLVAGAVLGGLARAAGLLLTRRPAAARDELAALGVLLRPAALGRARRRRAAVRRVPTRAFSRLFARRRARLAAAAAAAGDWLGGGAAPPGDPDAGLAPDAVPADRLLRRPAVLLGLALLAVAVLAERALLPGTGPGLSGGRLLPAPDALWPRVADGGPPALAVLAALSTVLLGSVRGAVDVVVLLAVPLGGLSAYACTGRLVRSPALRVWGAATWALLPVATGAVAAGRLDAAAGQVLLPPLLLQGVRLLGPHAGPRRPWRAGLLLAVVAALTPVVWVLVTVLLLGGALLGARPLRGVLTALAVPLVLLAPWWATAGRAALLHGPWPRPPGLADGAVLGLLDPGGPGTPAAALTAGLLLAALGATLRTGRARRTALLAWAVALTGLAAAGVLVRLVEGGARGWPGAALQVAAAGVLVAAAVAGDGLRGRLEQAAFGARQVTAAVVAVAAALTPVLLAGAWVVRGADGPLARTADPALPAFARAELDAAPGVRALVLTPRPGAALGWSLAGGDGPRLGDDDPAAQGLGGVVADLATPRGSAAAEALAVRAVRYVALRPGDAGLAGVLDGQPGLARRAAEPLPLWQVTAPTSRLQVLPPPLAAAARQGPPAAGLVLRGAPVAGAVPPGPPGRLLVLAEPAGEGWRASVAGRRLEPVRAWGWAQGFVLPPAGGAVAVEQGRTGRRLVLAGQALALLAVLVLAAPRAPRSRRQELPR